MYLYCAVDQYGNTIDFWLSRKRDRKAAKKFFRKALRSPYNTNPRVITTDKYAATIKTIKNEIKNKRLHPGTKYRSSKYMNNIIEQDHRHIKRITNENRQILADDSLIQVLNSYSFDESNAGI